MKVNERLGLTKNNNFGTEMKIIEVLQNDKIIVQFQDKFKHSKETHWNNFKRGTVLNPYDKTLYGVGYLGEGKYTCHDNGVLTNHYIIWANILCRCYYEKNRHLNSSYEGCGMVDNWHNLQWFSEWYYDNVYDAGDGGRLHVDKDILFKDNKLYSPETCIMVPQRINMLFMKKSRITDADLPAGIRRTMSGFSAEYNTKYLGVYEKLDKAIEQYEIEKRIHIKELADEYKKVMPSEVYNALINW